ncbi:RloB domain-containing protein [Actinomadura craniellae]|uniref:RloB domain-containing protein n=1 Tax=Actinomadura craniellae TaxID=2231787 RepID=A0A365H840_9ACTN|nr:RloB family protein [Actinomadura craniellae]RAY15257.1 RloB domain-containing protein [Actinomadura craniellae]
MAPRGGRRGGRSLKRTTGKRPELRTIVVFCEGVNSEPDYIRGLKKLPHVAANTALDLRIHPKQGVPLTLVKMAKEHKWDPEVDECWCIFDVEWPRNHPHLPEAVELARANGINLAISNPCFELWLILHYRNHSSFVDTDPAERLSRSMDNRSGKSIDADAYMPLRKEAAQRAQLLDARHEQDGTRFPHNNPSSGMYKLLREIEGE